jgi:hypothetical protein
VTPTLAGRLQTRFFLLLFVGGLVTLLITPVLPGGGSLSERYQTTFTVLALVAVVGIAWEIIYQGLQQFRWEKDWPTLFGLVTGVPEGIAAWLLLDAGVVPGIDGVAGTAFLLHFAAVWLCVWLFANGPMRVVSLRWRYAGGRLV